MAKISDSIKIGKTIGNFISGKESVGDMQALRSWINKSPENQSKFEILTDEKEIAQSIDLYEDVDVGRAWQKFGGKSETIGLRKQVSRLRVAASVVVVVGLAAIIASYLGIMPGNVAGGKECFTTVVTDEGQTSRIILPDSSIVWLNSGTQMTYNSNFSVKNRDIRLTGEAFFKVKRDESLPMVVSCNDLRVKVLGTEFDVSSFPGENKVSVVLEKGKVELSHADNLFQPLGMASGQMASFDETQKVLSLQKVDTYEHISWKDGFLIFNDAPMREVFKKLEHWYGVKIYANNPDVYGLVFNATIVDESLAEIFKLIKYTCDISYKIHYSHNPQIPVRVEVNYSNIIKTEKDMLMGKN